MYCRATSMITAGIWAVALSAQSPPWRFPGVPQFTATPPAPAVRPATARAPRQLLTLRGQEQPAVCSIPLRQVQGAKDVERMPVLRPRADNIDNMPSVKLPAPPCEEEQR